MTTVEKIKKIVDDLINERPILMDRFDGNYLSDFHHILRENFGIEDLRDKRLSKLVKLLNLKKTDSPSDLTLKLLSQLDEKDYLPHISSLSVKERYKYVTVPGWKDLENVKVDGTQESVEKAKKFLSLYSKQSGGNSEISMEMFKTACWGRSDELRLIQTGIINSHIATRGATAMLSIGPRWPTEIKLLRELFKIWVIGLDLFSNDESYIKIGDMHNMPFDNNSFDIVYERNTYNKSYDIRKALDESVRVLKPGGLLMYDEAIDYTIGVNENARTNIKTHLWVEKYLGDKIDQVLCARYDRPLPHDTFINKTGLFAATIKK